jgi:hypothetical protein
MSKHQDLDRNAASNAFGRYKSVIRPQFAQAYWMHNAGMAITSAKTGRAFNLESVTSLATHQHRVRDLCPGYAVCF